jgi:cob(I)alamin adenosyltransferase
MGHRLSKIYTRTGDKGTTGLSNGSRVAKDSLRVHAMGDIDELNCTIGLILICELNNETKNILIDIQHKLFNIGGELSLPGHTLIDENHVTWLETQLDKLNKDIEPLKDFILPGGSQASAFCHLARSVCRRAERSLIALKNERSSNESLSTPLVKYINRLSDFLFVLARYINKQECQPDVLWNSAFDKKNRGVETESRNEY